MPGAKFTKRARGSAKCSRQWADVEASAKARGADPGSAVRQANGALKKNKNCKPTK